MVGEWWQRRNFRDFMKLHTWSEIKEWNCILFGSEEMYSQGFVNWMNERKKDSKKSKEFALGESVWNDFDYEHHN
jgi:hypothetical protein